MLGTTSARTVMLSGSGWGKTDVARTLAAEHRNWHVLDVTCMNEERMRMVTSLKREGFRLILMHSGPLTYPVTIPHVVFRSLRERGNAN